MNAQYDPERVLIFAPHGRDAQLTFQLLRKSGLHGEVCNNIEQFLADMNEGATCAILTEEALVQPAKQQLERALGEQPAWSDFPLVLLSDRLVVNVEVAGEMLKGLGNVTLLDRPVKTRTLVSAVKAAQRSRNRQYQARQAIEQRDQFLAMLGHELRNPIGAIGLASETLRYKGEDRRRSFKQRSIIDRQVRHLSRLVDDLLDVSRVTSGKIVLKRCSIDLCEVLQRCVDSMQATARSNKVELGYAAPPNRVMVEGDSVRLEQVFSNLLTNAIKYSPAGSRVDLSVHLVSDRLNESVEVRIEDNGVGIEEAMLTRIFDLFAQVDSTLDRAQGGMGIGLTLVKRLVELHDGTIEAHSDGIGLGSRFSVRFPVCVDVRNEMPATVLQHHVFGRRVRVVLVEDNEDIRETSKEALEMLGCDVQVAGDGPSGVNLIVEHRPDLALVDIGLPGIDGYAVGKLVRQAANDAIFLIALTGYGLPEDHRRALLSGFDDHLTKPVTIAILERTIERALERRRSTEARVAE